MPPNQSIFMSTVFHRQNGRMRLMNDALVLRDMRVKDCRPTHSTCNISNRLIKTNPLCTNKTMLRKKLTFFVTECILKERNELADETGSDSSVDHLHIHCEIISDYSYI